MARISFLGDSNTNTYPKKEFDRHGHPSFCRLVAEAVGAAYDSYARCGSSFCGTEEASDARQGFIYTSDFRAFEKMRRAEGAAQPDVVALCLGTNDAFFFSGAASQSAFGDKVRATLERVSSCGATPVPLLVIGPLGASCPRKMAAMRNIVHAETQKLAASSRAVYISPEPLAASSYRAGDKAHLSPDGHRRLADLIAPVVAQLLSGEVASAMQREVGLTNATSTRCYMNAVLQAFTHTPSCRAVLESTRSAPGCQQLLEMHLADVVAAKTVGLQSITANASLVDFAGLGEGQQDCGHTHAHTSPNPFKVDPRKPFFLDPPEIKLTITGPL